MQKDYIINLETLALIQINDEMTKVIELDDEIIVNQPALTIIDYSCKYFGSSLIGRQEGSKYLLGFNYKLPILIDNSRNIIFFPTSSPKNQNCSWISYNNIEDYCRINKGINICFKNNKIVTFLISYGSFENQYYRTLKLSNIINKKKQEN